ICEWITNIKEPIRGRLFATQEDIANAVRQQVTRFTHGAANAEADGIQRLPHRWQSVETDAGTILGSLDQESVSGIFVVDTLILPPPINARLLFLFTRFRGKAGGPISNKRSSEGDVSRLDFPGAV
ncbi:UNVERIFIED_CONTAM: hypothetical protein NCL1_42570, partial [Trichonephila clavipes]